MNVEAMRQSSPIEVLIAQGTESTPEILRQQLNERDFHLTFADQSEQALTLLDEKPDRFDVFLLDHHAPSDQDLECLRQINSHPTHQYIPTILQSADDSEKYLNAGIEAGAYYFLHKPVATPVLRSLVHSAGKSRRRYKKASQERSKIIKGLSFMNEGQFQIRTLDQIPTLVATLSCFYPDSDRVTLGIHELLTNAIEHGNLAISFDTKTTLVEQGTWREEIERRQKMDGFRQRYVSVQLRKTGTYIDLIITDQGAGFDVSDFMELKPERLFCAHGRGIAVAKKLSFDDLFYNSIGNQVTTRIQLTD